MSLKLGCGVLFLGLISWSEAQQLGADLRRANQRYRQVEEPGDAGSAADVEVNRLAAGAAEFYRTGEIAKAIDQYDRAAAVAFRSGATGRALEFSLVSAELERNQGNWLLAADRFERAALANSNDPRAAATHLAACELLTKSLGQSVTEPRALDALLVERLDNMLGEHGTMWPNSPSALKAAWQRIELLAIRSKWDELLEAAHGISPVDQRFGRSQELLVMAHSRIFATQEAADQLSPRMVERLSAMTVDLEAIVLGKLRRWPTRWTDLQCQAAEALARAHLWRGEVGAEYAKRLLGVALQRSNDSKQELHDSMTVLYTVSAIVLEDYQAADSQLARLMPDTKDRRALLQATHDRLFSSPPSGWSVEADRLLITIRNLRGDAADDLGNGLTQFDALVAAGRKEEALRLLDDLTAGNPKDRELLIAKARLLSEGRQTDELEQSLRGWHEIEARSARSSKVWFEARLERLRLLIALDRKEEALKLMKLTKLLSPTLGGDNLQSEFEVIEIQLQD